MIYKTILAVSSLLTLIFLTYIIGFVADTSSDVPSLLMLLLPQALPIILAFFFWKLKPHGLTIGAYIFYFIITIFALYIFIAMNDDALVALPYIIICLPLLVIINIVLMIHLFILYRKKKFM